jgi:hypothetical protein
MGLYSDLSLNSGEYIPQYAGAPLAEMQKTADTLAGRHYQNIAQANQLEIMANQLKSKLLPGAKGYVDQHINSINEALAEMAKSGGENATARVQALARTLQGDQGILNGLQRAQEYAKQTEAIDALKLKGEIPLFDEARRKQLEAASATDELYNSPYSMEVEPYKSPTPEMDEVWNVIKPDSYEGAIHAAMNTTAKNLLGKNIEGMDPDLPLFFESITTSGISGQKIKDMLDNAWSTYQNSESFKQQTGKLVGKSPAQVKQEFYKRGLMGVYSNLQRTYNATPAAALNGGSGSTAEPAAINVPMDATVRTNFDKNTSVIPGVVDKALLNSERKVIEGQLNSMAMTDKIAPLDAKALKEKAKLEKRLGEINAEEKRTQADVDAEQLATFKTAVEVLGTQPISSSIYLGKPGPQKTTESMTDAEWKAFMQTPEGQTALNQYNQQYQSLRYNNAFATVPLTSDASQTNEQFLQKTAHFRKIMPVDGSEEPTTIMNENNEPASDELAVVNEAISTGQFEYIGMATPRNLFAKKANDKSFTRAIRVRIKDPNKAGATKDYFLSQPAGMTTPIDTNENVLWERATSKPGAFVPAGGGYEIQTMPTVQQREKLYPKYGTSVEVDGQYKTIDQAKFVNNPETVLLKTKDGKVIPFANYSMAAKYLADQGVELNIE